MRVDSAPSHQVNVEMVMEQMKKNSQVALGLIIKSVCLLSTEDWTDTIRKTQVGTPDK